jgi:putative transposase
MPRKLRIEYPGAVYHVTNRGDRGGVVFADDEDRERFLATLGEAALKTGWAVHAYCLLPDHFHLVVETPQPSLVAGMKWLLGTFTNRTNRRHHARGHLFAGRYRALPVAPEGGYFRTACEHVLLNPARARLIGESDSLVGFPWTSLPGCLRPPGERPAWLQSARLLAACDGSEDSPAGRQRLLDLLETRRASMTPADWRGLRRGWYFGDTGFGASLLNPFAAGSAVIRHGVVPRAGQELTGRQIIAEELAKQGRAGADLARTRKTDPGKVAIAQRLRRETTLSLRWVAAELRAGSVNTLRNALAAVSSAAPAEAGPSPRAIPRQLTGRTAPPGPGAGGQKPATPPIPATPDSAPFSVAWD